MMKHKLQVTLIVSTLLVSSLVWAANEPQTTDSNDANKSTTTTTQTTTTTTTSTAPTVDPITMLKGVTSNVLAALKANSQRSDRQSRDIYTLVDNYILPYVDFNEMSVWVAGKTAWSKASEQSREQFVAAFKILVVHTYATALNSYSNEKVEFVPQKIDPNKNRVQVSSWIVRPNKENIRVDYRLVKNGNEWKVYDIIIEGVSILQGFQAQFSQEIRSQGLQSVISKIEKHNKDTGKLTSSPDGDG